mgnify:CR=1 FL=1
MIGESPTRPYFLFVSPPVDVPAAGLPCLSSATQPTLPFLSCSALGIGCGFDAAGWAQRFCAAEAQYAATLTPAFDNLDPNTLDIEARKQRADRIGFKLLDGGRKVRVFKSNGEQVDA